MTDVSGPFMAFSELHQLAAPLEPIRAGHPGVVVVCCLLVVIVAVVAWLRRAMRPIPPPRGRLTVGALQSRLDHEVLAEIERARLAEFQRLAEKEASERATADTVVIPAVEGTQPRNEAAQQAR
ncbi:hypothetical protein [Amycolatopsis sp. NPDC004079]|uniref:hypothetical protein n=1 Tax=Amycolatopsis sp. NPDC004079 TaxID=3154549 RepID=UPI0033A102D4